MNPKIWDFVVSHFQCGLSNVCAYMSFSDHEEQHGTVVKIFDCSAKVPCSIPGSALKFVFIPARSITASDLWGRCNGWQRPHNLIGNAWLFAHLTLGTMGKQRWTLNYLPLLNKKLKKKKKEREKKKEEALWMGMWVNGLGNHSPYKCLDLKHFPYSLYYS